MFILIGADQKHYGPASAEEVREWIRDGRADGRTLARVEEDTEWKPLTAYPEFAEFTAASGAPPRLASQPEVDLPAVPMNFSVGECLVQSRGLLAGHFNLMAAAVMIYWLIYELFCRRLGLLGSFMDGVLYGGLCFFILKLIRRQPVMLFEVFSGFGGAFSQLAIAGFLTTLLCALSIFFCLLPAIFLKVAWIFTLPLVIDKRLRFWPAMQLSRKATMRVWLKVFALAVIAFAPYLLSEVYLNIQTYILEYPKWHEMMLNGGYDFSKLLSIAEDATKATMTLNIATQVVLLINLPFAAGALLYAYEALFGSRKTPGN